MMRDAWVSRADAAARAGVHRNTIIDWERRELVRTRRDLLPSGEQVMVNVEDLERIVADRRPGSRSVAVLEAENAALRERLEAVERERDKLLRELLAIARGR